MNSSIFKAAPFFFIQAASGSKEELDLILSQKNWEEAVISRFENDPQFSEAVLVASPSLYHSLQKKPLKDPKALAISLFRYLVRMSTRSTPFGHFSLVMNGVWAEKTDVLFDVSKIQRRVRPDMEWIFLLVRKHYEDKKAFPSLPVQANRLAIFEGDRVILNYIHRLEEGENNPVRTISIRATPLIKAIFRLAKRPIQIAHLWDKLLAEIPSLAREQTEEFLHALLEQQLLIPALLPSLLSTSPFKELCSSLSQSSTISEIAHQIGEYEKTKIGSGEHHLLDLQKSLEALVPVKQSLQVDTYYPQQAQRVGKLVAKELEETLDLLWKLSPVLNPPSPLEEYLENFTEFYGTYRTIPLMELFSENRGIGPFKNSGRSSNPRNMQIAEAWELFLSREWQNALHSGKDEIVLTSQVVDDFLAEMKLGPVSPGSALPSLDVFCKVFAESSEAIDRGEFEILYSQSNWQGGGAAGRFLDLLGEGTENKFREYFRAEEALEPQAIFVELSYWPFAIRNANVAIQPCLRSYRLDLEERTTTAQSLCLEDIHVGVGENRFYLTIKEGGKELIFRSGNFLNPEFAPAPLKFCRDVSLFRSQRLSAFSWGSVGKQAIFLPRVRFQKTILKPAEWNLRLSDLRNSNFLDWAKEWKLPRRFFILQNDQSLLFDRDHPHCVQEINRILTKEKSLRLVEQRGSNWLESTRGNHLTELVIPFLRNASSEHTIIPRPYSAVPFSQRWKLQGSEWVHINFYLNSEGIHDFLVDHLPKLADHLSRLDDALGWFFIRYDLPAKHVRFRFHFSSTTALSSVLTLLEQATSLWMAEGRIRRHELSNYQREVERYGGPGVIDLAEEFFYADSLSVLFLLRSPLFKTPDISLYAVSILCFIKDLGLTHEEIISCLGTRQDESLLKGYRQNKNRLSTLVRSLEAGIESKEVNLLKEGSLMRSQAAERFSFAVKEKEEKQEIFRSLLHMHCNRLGLDGLTEQRALMYAKHALKQYLGLGFLSKEQRFCAFGNDTKQVK